VDRFRFLDMAGNVAALVVELDVLLAQMVSSFCWSTCVLTGPHAEEEGEYNAAPNGVVSSSCRLDGSVVSAKHGGRNRFGSGCGNPGSGHSFDDDLVSGGETDGDVAGGFMTPCNSADLGHDGGSAVGSSVALVEVPGIP